MCMPNQTDELRRIFNEADYIDRCIELLKPRSPRAGGEQIPAPSLPAAGAGDADSRLDFDRDSQTLEERCALLENQVAQAEQAFALERAAHAGLQRRFEKVMDRIHVFGERI